jgi:DNA helicase HerA-like ATPase
MRSTADLIEELDREAGNFTRAALVVGFENTTTYVFSTDENRLDALNDLVRNGGEPIGLFGIDLSHGLLNVHHRTLDEYADASWAERYLEALLAGFREQLQQTYPDAVKELRFPEEL